MKLSVECVVHGLDVLEHETSVTNEGREYTFLKDKDSRLSAIRITKPLPNAEAAHSRVTRDGDSHKLEQHFDLETLNELLGEFQQLESMLGFSAGVKGIDWQNPKTALIPETHEELTRVNANHIHVRQFFDIKPKLITPANVLNVVSTMGRYRSLNILLAFHREAGNEMENHRFIAAFINAFYVLEALYANGQFGAKEVLREFEKSDVLKKDAQRTLDSPIFTDGEHRAALDEALAYYQKDRNVRGLLYVLVQTRGELHHYVKTRNRRYGTPFRHAEYYTLALAARHLESAGLAEEIRKINMAYQVARAGADTANKVS